MKFSVLVLSFLSLLNASAAIWYVERDAAGANNGTSWANAWNNTTQIVWASLAAGDTVYISGGASGKSYSAFTTAKAGASGNPILIQRSTESGRNGTVTIASPVIINSQWIVVDGVTWGGIVVTLSGTDGSTEGGYSVRTGGNNHTMKWIKLQGTYGGGFGHSLGCTANNLTAERIWFDRSLYEDHIHYQGQGTLSISYSYFHHYSKPSDSSHRDLCNPWTTGGFNLNFDNNLVENDGSGNAGDGDGWLMQNTSQLLTVNMRGNVFYRMHHALRFGSGNAGVQTVNLYNNVYDRVTDYDGPTTGLTMRNCIFRGTGSEGNPSHATNGKTQYSMWIVGSGNFESATGNQNSQVSASVFLNATSVKGTDGIPFTSDDGYNFASGSSPGIDDGTNVGRTTDILGNAVSGTPDVGPYEYQAGDSTAPTLSSATIATSGTNLTLIWSEACVVGSGGSGNISTTLSVGSATWTYSSGSGTTTWVYESTTPVYMGVTATVSYTQPGNGIEDAAGNDLVTFSGSAVTNNSTQQAPYVGAVKPVSGVVFANGISVR